MRAHVYKYEDSKKQSCQFRGYIKTYKDSEVVITICPEVRPTYAAAERDAKKLLKTLSK